MQETSKTNISNILIGNVDARLPMKEVQPDFIVAFNEMTYEERVNKVKKDISDCVDKLGFYVSRTSAKQLAKDFGSIERYNQICRYEDDYAAILKKLLKHGSQND